MNSSSPCCLSASRGMWEGRWMDSSDVNKISTNRPKWMKEKAVMLHMSLWICQPLSVWSAVTWLYIHSLDPDLWITAHVLKVKKKKAGSLWLSDSCIQQRAEHEADGSSWCERIQSGLQHKALIGGGSLQQSGLVWCSHQIVKQRSRVYFSSLCCRGFPAVWSNCVKILLLMSVSF